ncbi:MAG: hypothetical protein ACREEB_06635 [Caulobacteraceae bacterium]
MQCNRTLFYGLILTFGMVGVGPSGFVAASAQSAPVHQTKFGSLPSYPFNVTSSNRFGPHSGAIHTKDPIAKVLAWYRKHLPAGSSEKAMSDGHHLFGVPGAGAVDIAPGLSFNPGTTIGITFK